MTAKNIYERMENQEVLLSSGAFHTSHPAVAVVAEPRPLISNKAGDKMFSAPSKLGRLNLVFSMATVVLAPASLGAQSSATTPARSVSNAKPSLQAPVDIAGNWQGTLEFPGNASHPGMTLRIVLKIEKTASGGLTALNYSIDQSSEPIKTAEVTLAGVTFKYSIPAINGRYEGQLSADGNSIVGNWIQGSQLPLLFVRATSTVAWPIPAPPEPPKPMGSDVDPVFEVATIKPSAPDKDGKYFRVYGRRFLTHETSLDDLIAVAYGLHPKQITGAPGWAESVKFDLAGMPAGEGEPDGKQWLIMVQKLLADRFKLTFHHEQRQVSAYVLSTSKDGPLNLTKNDSANPLPSMEFRPVAGGVLLPAKNATTEQFAQMMQQAVLDRPVIDKTGLTGKFDFQLTFAPDSSQFNGRPPALPQQADATNSLPGLYDAMRHQLGLKLTVEKIAIDVLVIDHAERPSEN